MYIHLGLSFQDSYNPGCNAVEFSICEPFERHSHGTYMDGSLPVHPFLLVRMLLALIQYTTRTEGGHSPSRLGFALLVPRRARSQRLIHPTQPTVRELGGNPECIGWTNNESKCESVNKCQDSSVPPPFKVSLLVKIYEHHSNTMRLIILKETIFFVMRCKFSALK